MSPDFLSEIIADKRSRVALAREAGPFAELQACAQLVRSEIAPRALTTALRKGLAAGIRLNIISEFKRASPSKGIIREGARAAEMARDYEANGAVAISVLTEEGRFMGSMDDLRAVRTAVGIPILRKDFIVDEYQLYESAAAGADAVLLIVAALADDELTKLREVAEDKLGLDALVEVHTQDELQRAFDSGATLIGVNNRDLRTFEVSLQTSLDLAPEIPSSVISISESGLRTADDLRRLSAAGYQGFLIGESFMREESPGRALRALLDDAAIPGFDL